jgi:kynurenine formamidase
VTTDDAVSVVEVVPPFDELPVAEGLGLRHAWDVLPRDLGTLALQSPARLLQALGAVRDGVCVNLNLPVDEPDPPLFGRESLRHTVFKVDRNTADDRLDAFYPQSSSQWDGLRHIRARELGYFGGGHTEDFAAEGGPLGMEHFAEHGIAGRGVLLDVAGHRERRGAPLDPFAAEAIGPEELAEVAEAQGVELKRGDVLCVRTSWIDGYRALGRADREEVARAPRISGLAGSEAMARFVWDAGVSALALDNPSAEVAPGDPAVGSLHRRLIPMLGVVVGELLDLGRLARLCAADGRWDFLFVAVPMHLPGGIGSPANAVAIR